MRRTIVIGIAVLVAVGALVGLLGRGRPDEAAKSSGGGASSATGAASAPSKAASRAADALSTANAPADPGVPSESAAGGATDSAGVGSAVPALPNLVVKHAQLEIRAPRRALAARVQAARDLAAAAGGFVEHSDRGPTSATIALRVPTERYADVLLRLGELGHVTTSTEQADDVTGQVTDLDARLRNLQAQEAVLRNLMNQARTVPDSIAVQQQLSGIQEQIEQLAAQRGLLANQASYATVAVSFSVPGVVAPHAAHRSTLAQAWHDAIDVSLAIVGGVIVVLGAAIPIGIVVLIGLGGWSLVRRRRVLTPADLG